MYNDTVVILMKFLVIKDISKAKTKSTCKILLSDCHGVSVRTVLISLIPFTHICIWLVVQRIDLERWCRDPHRKATTDLCKLYQLYDFPPLYSADSVFLGIASALLKYL